MNTPTILVFYVFSETFKNRELIDNYGASIQALIEKRGYNMLVFFLPTETEERIECINPVIATPDQLEKIDLIINELKNKFSINKDDETTTA